MKTHKQLTLLGVTACILGLITSEPSLHITACIFVTGSMIIKGIREPVEVQGISVDSHTHGITSDKTGAPK